MLKLKEFGLNGLGKKDSFGRMGPDSNRHKV
jgi:hypothetical protein